MVASGGTMSSLSRIPSASLLATLLDAGVSVLTQNVNACENAQRLKTRAKHACETATRVIDSTRELILTRRPHRFRAICGASDARPGGLHESVWISAAVANGAVCTECGRAIIVGETMYDVVADGREMRLDSRCGRLHMEQLRSKSSDNVMRPR